MSQRVESPAWGHLSALGIELFVYRDADFGADVGDDSFVDYKFDCMNEFDDFDLSAAGIEADADAAARQSFQYCLNFFQFWPWPAAG